MKLQIFIPSRSRFDESRTLDRLKFGGFSERAVLVVPRAQERQYLRGVAKQYRCEVIGIKEEGIAATRRRIGEIAENKFIMLDDDLRFFVRDRNGTGLLQMPADEYPVMFKRIERLLDKYAHVAIGARQGNNTLEPDIDLDGFLLRGCSRPLRALAYRKKEFMACKHERVHIMEDFDVTLQLLRNGYKNAVTVTYAQDHIATQLPGGCSDYRTLKVHNKNVRLMKELHPDYIKVRIKENKSIGGLLTRLEATIFWRKAWESSWQSLI